MAELRDLMVYLCVNYPMPGDLSNARLTKLVYLCDWEHARQTGRQATDIEWLYNHHGPWVSDVRNLAARDKAFDVKQVANAFGSPKELIQLAAMETPHLDDEVRQVADEVIRKTSPMYFGQFIDYVYATFPVKQRPKYSYLDLEKLAQEERDVAAAERQTGQQAARAALDRYIEMVRGGDLPDDMVSVVEIPENFEDPTVEDISLPETLPAPRGAMITVKVDLLVDGFMAKADAYVAEEEMDVGVHDHDWNDFYAWVYFERSVHLTFDLTGTETGGLPILVAVT